MTILVITNKHIINGTFDKSIILNGTTHIIIMDSTLTSLPNGLKVDALTIMGCPNLTYLPADLDVMESINLECCTGLPYNDTNIRQLDILAKYCREVSWPEHLWQGRLNQNSIPMHINQEQLKLNSKSPKNNSTTYLQYIETKKNKPYQSKHLENNGIEKLITTHRKSKQDLLRLKYNELYDNIQLSINSRPNPDLARQYNSYLNDLVIQINSLSTIPNNIDFYKSHINCLNNLENIAKKLTKDFPDINVFRTSPTSVTNVSSLSPVPQISQSAAFTATNVILVPKPQKSGSSPLMGGGYVASTTAGSNKNSNAGNNLIGKC